MDYEDLARRLEEGADDQGRGVIDVAAQVIREAGKAHGYAERLAVAIHARHYADVVHWKPLHDLIGLLNQIDNMTSGLVKARRELLSVYELLRIYDDCGGDWCKIARAVELSHGVGV